MNKKVLVLLLLIATIFCVVACKDISTSYDVTFVGFNDEVLKTEIVKEGYDATAPEVVAPDNYVFVGWDTEFKCVKNDLTVKALFDPLYTITFIGFENEVLKTEVVQKGHNATAPEVVAPEGFKFTGWDVDFENVQSNLMVTAQFDLATYTITFVDYEGTVLATITVEYGQTINATDIPTADEVNAADTRIGYNFTGWDIDVSEAIKANTTITAQYEEVAVYTVYFHTYMGSIVKEVKVEEGDVVAPLAEEEIPVREYWDFVAWIVNNIGAPYDFSTSITGDLHLFASYQMHQTTIKFVDYDGEVIRQVQIPAGVEFPSNLAPDAAFMTSTYARKGFVFVGWDIDPADYTTIPMDDITFTAVYEDCIFVSFVDYEGTEFVYVNIGADKLIPENMIPTAEIVDAADERVGFKFIGWDKDVTLEITENTVFTAQYEEVAVYTVYFHTYMGSIVKEVKVEEGDVVAPLAEEEIPVREYWDFVAWIVNNIGAPYDFSTPITGELHLFASYQMHQTTIKFVDYDGEVIRQVQIPAGVEFPSNLAPDATFMNETYPREGYTFIGWDIDPADYTTVPMEDLTFTAQYEKNN